MSKEELLRQASRGPCQGTFSSPKDSVLGFCALPIWLLVTQMNLSKGKSELAAGTPGS